MKKNRCLAVFSTFIFCYGVWILLTLSFNPQELLAGAVVSLGVAMLTARFFIHEDPLYLFNPQKLLNLILYLFVFLKELFKANIDVAKRALNPNLPVNPGIVKVPVDVESEYGIAMLANSITLTPGTITMDIAEEKGQNYFYIHWIDVASKDQKEAGDAIKGTLENWVRRIWK